MSNKKADREKVFAQEYVKDLNGTRAAIAAGYSESTARQQASRLLTKSNVKDLIAKFQESAAEECGITAKMVLAEIAKLGFANMMDYLITQEDGTAYCDFSKLTRDQAAAIQEVTTDEWVEGKEEETKKTIRRVKFKLSDKRGSLELLGRHLKLFSDKVEHSGPTGGPVRVIVEHIAA